MLPHRRKLRLLTAAAVVGASTLVAALWLTKSPSDDVWDVIVQGFPTRLAPEYASHNVDLYILRQTHEPIFRVNPESGQFESRILKSWERSLDNRKLTLCPNDSIEFRPGDAFSASFLKVFLATKLESMPKHGPFGVAVEGTCVVANFSNPEPDALYFLSRFEQAPSIMAPDRRLEIGLGPFLPLSRSEDEIVLTRKHAVRHSYNKIILHQWKGPQDPLLASHSIEDFNRIPSGDIPAWVKDNYSNYGVNLLNTAVLIINHPDLAVRRVIYNCARSEELRTAFYTTQHTFFDIATVTPVGLLASKAGLPKVNCVEATDSLRGLRVTMANYKENNIEQMEAWSRNFNLRSGLKLDVASVPLQTFIDGGLKRPHASNLYIMSLDTPYASYDDFFSGFVLPQDKVSLTDVDIPEVKEEYKAFQASKDTAEQNDHAKKLNSLFEKYAIALPLFQVVRPFYPTLFTRAAARHLTDI